MSAEIRSSASKGELRSAVPPIAVFLLGAVLLLAATRIGIPLLIANGAQPHLSWFICGGLGVFVPLILISLLLLRREAGTLDRIDWSSRLRFRAISASDWVVTLKAWLIMAVVTGVLAAVLAAGAGAEILHPPFLPARALTAEEGWVLAAWVPFWLLNILGEEFAWRGVLLPIQQDRFADRAWLVHGFCWGLFHLAFGWAMIVLLLPILFGLPYAVQRTRNTWVGVILHGALNGPAFVAISLGLL